MRTITKAAIGALILFGAFSTDVHAAEAVSLNPWSLSLVDGEIVQGEIEEHFNVECASLYTFELPGQELMVQCIHDGFSGITYYNEASDGIHEYADVKSLAAAYWPGKRYLNSAQKWGDEFVIVFASN